jgi:predicted protein tyrosine phosphatase
MQTIFISRVEAESMVGQYDTIALISIYDDEGAPQLKATFKNLLGLQFSDIDYFIPAYPHLTIFEEDHAKAIIRFLKELPADVKTIIVHCYAGISRSAAVCKFIADMFHIEGFNHYYPLYNKHIYKVLTETYIKGEENV